MIRAARTMHRWLFTLLPLLVLPLFLVAVMTRDSDRKGVVPATALASELGLSGSGRGTGGGETLSLDGLGVDVRVEGSTLEVGVRESLQRPAPVLLCDPAGDATPLAELVAIGRLRGSRWQRFELPADCLGQRASLVLYSIGHAEILARSPLRGRVGSEP